MDRSARSPIRILKVDSVSENLTTGFNHKFIASLSTEDINYLLSNKYADISEEIRRLEANQSKTILNLVANSQEKEKESVTDNKTKNGLIRLALFLGDSLIKMNLKNDPIDNSDITRLLLNKFYELENKTIFNDLKMTMRISDRGGYWKENYDSVFVGPVELDDGTKFNLGPLWCVKDYERQMVLSCHLLDREKCCIK